MWRFRKLFNNIGWSSILKYYSRMEKFGEKFYRYSVRVEILVLLYVIFVILVKFFLIFYVLGLLFIK